MRRDKLTISSLIAVVFLITTFGSAFADRGRDKSDNRGWDKQDDRPTYRHENRDYVLDRRHQHNHYYPRSGYIARELPRGYYRVPYRGLDYYFYDGIWFRSSGVQFTVIAPPIGVVIPVLPRFYTTIMFGGLPYYYADDTYYRWYPEQNGYLVVEPPEGAESAAAPVVPDKLFVYPRQGQSDAVMAKDRYECHRWSVDQTSFDPTKPGGDVALEENASKRQDYNRATKSCLEARGYSVQ